MFRAIDAVLDHIRAAASLFRAAIRAAVRYPVFLVPLLIVWSLYAPLTIYLTFEYDWDSYPDLLNLAVAFGAVFAISSMMSMACLVLLEQIRRIETGQRPTIKSSVFAAAKNFGRALPVVLIWAVLWFVISIFETLTRDDREINDQPPTPENIARTLAGDGYVSFSSAFFAALKKGIRMLAFLIFPAIAWENDDRPIRRGLAVARTHKREFAAGFALTEMAGVLLFLPPAFMFWVADETQVQLTDADWAGIILYIGFAWSFMLLLEQLFTAELYLWDLKWREACVIAEENGDPLPSLHDVPKPLILDKNPDLLPSA